MSEKRYAIQINNQRPTQLGLDKAAALKKIAEALQKMNGKEFWFVAFWEIPENKNTTKDVIPFTEDYLQFTGSADEMSVEVRVSGERRSVRHYTVGKPQTKSTVNRTRVIHFSPYDTWRQDSVEVADNEVFSAADAEKVAQHYYTSGQVPGDYLLRELHLASSRQPTNDRPLTFIDAKGDQLNWQPGDKETAYETFGQFMKKRIWQDNARFTIKDIAAQEELMLLIDSRAIRRVKHGSPTVSQYALSHTLEDYLDKVQIFIKREGYDALDKYGPWLPDEASLKKALYQDIFRGTSLATTHPTELRHRLAVLSYINGTPPIVTDDATHYRFDTPSGDFMKAWFKQDGRGLLVTYSTESPLSVIQDPKTQTSLYDGVPEDLRQLAGNGPATGVFLFTRPCEMSDGVLNYTIAHDVAMEYVGTPVFLEQFLEIKDFTPRAVNKIKVWWSNATIKTGFREAEAFLAKQPAKLHRAADTTEFLLFVDGLARRDKANIHYVFHLNPDGAIQRDMLAVAKQLGLERVEPPTGATGGDVWIRTDPLIDAELESWSSIGVRTGTRLQKSLDRAGIAEQWPLWCDQSFNWSKRAKYSYDSDSLLREDGSYETLLTETVMDAFSRAGAQITDETRVIDEVDRTFTVIIREDTISVALEIQLGLNNNSIDCFFIVRQGNFLLAQPEHLIMVTYDILVQRGEKFGSIRPVLVSHSHLEVVSKQMVVMMRKVAKEWNKRLQKD